MQRGDADGFLARMLIISPKLVSFKYEDYQLNKETLGVEQLLKAIKNQHNTSNIAYTFDTAALQVYIEFFNYLNETMTSKDVFEESDQRSVLNKMAVSVKKYSRHRKPSLTCIVTLLASSLYRTQRELLSLH